MLILYNSLTNNIRYSPVAQWYLPAGRQGAGSMYVYILKSIKYGRYYIGLTGNVVRRFIEHNNGWVKKTRFYRQFELIHVEIVRNLVEARILEKYFKSGYGKDIIREIEEFSKI